MGAIDPLKTVVIILAVVAILLAAVLLVRRRPTGTARLLGREVYRPGLAASALTCLGVSMLVRMSSDAMPVAWREPASLVGGGLILAVVVLVSIRFRWRRTPRQATE
ncbi:hypothetical protein [Micromonospora gifhornensis]|uniref:hypothetical protein n=1 Tax=Micromonospora gifhornensis TaxID=84594 RepID=UPI003D74FA32